MLDIFLYGSLKKKPTPPSHNELRIDLQGPTTLTAVLERLQIPVQKVQLAMVNHRSVPKEASVSPGDRLSLFPREYIIFGEWKDHRF
jgi:hypothetical protein